MVFTTLLVTVEFIYYEIKADTDKWALKEEEEEHAASYSTSLLHLINVGLQIFMFDPRCFDISFGKVENSKKYSANCNYVNYCKVISYFIKAIN